MTFREYLNKCDFEAIWLYLNRHFKEKKETEPLYKSLYDTIKALPVCKTGGTIVMTQFSDGEWELTNILDPHKELIDREVYIKTAYRRRKPKDTVIAAHLLFWSSMYGFKTSEQYQQSFGEWLRKRDDGPFYEMDSDNLECSKHIRKWLFFVPSLTMFAKNEFDRLKDSETGFDEMKTTMNRVLTETGVAEISQRTHAEIMVFLPKEWESQYPELEDAIAELPMKTRLTKWYGDMGTVNEVIGKCRLAKYVPYVIVSKEDAFDCRHKEFLFLSDAGGRLSPDSIEKAVASLNRFDDYSYNDFYPNEKAERKEQERIGKITGASVENKRQHYWKRTIKSDYTYDSSANLLILKKKLEYNIGYWKYVKRFERSAYDISRMQIACRLCEIAAEEDYNLKPEYVNVSNAARYTKKHRLTFTPEDSEFYLPELYQLKAYTILWQVLDHNMRSWWD